jgi:signal peptidase I
MNEPSHARADSDATESDAGVAVPADPASPRDTGATAEQAHAHRIGGPGASGTASVRAGTRAGVDVDEGVDHADGDDRLSGTAPRDDNDEHTAAVQRWREKSRRRRKPAKKRPWWIEVPILLVTAFVLTFLIQTFLFKVYYVPSGSMEQTLHGVESGGDRILVNKVINDFSDPEPGDVVVFKGPPTWAAEANIPGPSSWLGKLGQAVGSVVGIAPPNEKDYVKRVIAVGGQTVRCCDATGNVLVDGVALNEPYIYEPLQFIPGVRDCSQAHLAQAARINVSQRCFGPVTVPVGQLWVMGDHRSRSADSSYQCQGGGDPGSCQGPVPVADVIGKAIFIIMPISRWDTIGDPKIDHRNGG